MGNLLNLYKELEDKNIIFTEHSLNVQQLTEKFVLELDINNKYEIIYFSKFHDIGKVTLLDILNVKRRLTLEEFEEIKKHTLYGAEILKKYSTIGYNICMFHHENYLLGNGYWKLKQDEIPLEAQIIKIVDVYEALRSKRSYKPPYSHKQALEIMNFGDDRTNPYEFNLNLLEKFNEIF